MAEEERIRNNKPPNPPRPPKTPKRKGVIYTFGEFGFIGAIGGDFLHKTESGRTAALFIGY